MPKTMKAANLYAPGDIRVEEVPVPEPGEGWVLVKVTACGVCGSDIPRVMKTGTYSFPTIPGHEFAGEVAQLGPGVEGTKAARVIAPDSTSGALMRRGIHEGLRVTVIPMMPCRKCDYCSIGAYQLCESYDYVGSRRDGAFAEYVRVPARNLLALPESVDFELGAMTDPVAIALHAVKKLAMKPGDRAAVFGVGPIGLFAIQWAKVMGASEVFAIDVLPEKLRVAEGLGADRCVNAREEDPVAKILALTGGKGVERTVEFAGLPVTQEQCILAASKLGSSVWGGISHEPLPLGEKAVDEILRKELVISGSWNSSFARLGSDWKTSLVYMGQGRIRAGDIVTHRLPLEEAASAFKMMLAREEYFNKVMFFPGGSSAATDDGR